MSVDALARLPDTSATHRELFREMDPEAVKRLIEDGLTGSQVQVTGDGRHFEAVVVNEAFAGKNVLQQHRMVYAALGDSFDTEAVHALALKTYTPAQWEGLGT